MSPLLPAIGWFLLSVILLSFPGSSLPKEDWLSRLWIDKWVHLVLFGILVITWCRGITNLPGKRESRRLFLVIAVLALLYGIIMEFVQQHLIPNRSFDTGDIAADAAGCLAGYFFSAGRYIKK